MSDNVGLSSTESSRPLGRCQSVGVDAGGSILEEADCTIDAVSEAVASVLASGANLMTNHERAELVSCGLLTVTCNVVRTLGLLLPLIVEVVLH